MVEKSRQLWSVFLFNFCVTICKEASAKGVWSRQGKLEHSASCSQTYLEHFFCLFLSVFIHFHSVTVTI